MAESRGRGARWVKGLRVLLRAVAAGSAILFATSLNPLGVIPAPEVLNAASLIALITIPSALLFDVVVPPAGRRLGPAVRLLLAIPATIVAFVWIALSSGLPSVVNRVTAPGGQQYLLGIGPMSTDVDYQLWRSVGPAGQLWKPAGTITWSEDGRFTEDPELVLVHERWLMVRRGGIWTDCYEILANSLKSCGGGYVVQDWQDPDAWRRASAEMAARVGATPEETQAFAGTS